MAEHEVMWIGRRPAALAPEEQPSATEAFAEAVTAACEDCGAIVHDYVAAAGIHGSWLVRFEHGGAQQRMVWNGKEGSLVLEQAGPGRNWTELGSTGVAERDLDHFALAIRSLLDRPA